MLLRGLGMTAPVVIKNAHVEAPGPLGQALPDPPETGVDTALGQAVLTNVLAWLAESRSQP